MFYIEKALKRLTVIIAIFLFIVCASTLISMANSKVANVSTNCNVKEFNVGDEVRMDLHTNEMDICTFIAYVEYDSELLDYIGYVGPNQKKVAYLETSGSGKSIVNIEHAENAAIVGMYAIGTEEQHYKAGTPLVTLIFKAKKSGNITEKSFIVSETSDGTDGYTSQRIMELSNSSDDSGSGATGLKQEIKEQKESSKEINTMLLIFIVIALIALGIVVGLMFFKKKKIRKNK